MPTNTETAKKRLLKTEAIVRNAKYTYSRNLYVDSNLSEAPSPTIATDGIGILNGLSKMEGYITFSPEKINDQKAEGVLSPTRCEKISTV